MYPAGLSALLQCEASHTAPEVRAGLHLMHLPACHSHMNIDATQAWRRYNCCVNLVCTGPGWHATHSMPIASSEDALLEVGADSSCTHLVPQPVLTQLSVSSARSSMGHHCRGSRQWSDPVGLSLTRLPAAYANMELKEALQEACACQSLELETPLSHPHLSLNCPSLQCLLSLQVKSCGRLCRRLAQRHSAAVSLKAGRGVLRATLPLRAPPWM